MTTRGARRCIALLVVVAGCSSGVHRSGYDPYAPDPLTGLPPGDPRNDYTIDNDAGPVPDSSDDVDGS